MRRSIDLGYKSRLKIIKVYETSLTDLRYIYETTPTNFTSAI